MRRIIYFVIVALIAVSCFDDMPTNSEKYTLDANFEVNDAVFGSDSVRFDHETGLGIGYMDLAFYHKLNPQKTAVVGGFALSRLKGSGSELGRNDLRVNSGAGLDGSPTYAVFKYDEPNMPEHDIQFLNNTYGTCEMMGCYVNNTAEVVDSIRTNFQSGDRLTLKAVGYLQGVKTGEAEIDLASYSALKDSIVVSWTPFYLNKLGSVEYVEFEIISTKENVPTSVCIDDVVARISLEY